MYSQGMVASLAAALLASFPVIGLHLGAPSAGNIDKFCTFVQQNLKAQGVNLLLLEVDYGFQFKSRPEMSDPAGLPLANAKKIVKACRDAGIEVVPEINLLGHQSWAEDNTALLVKHPEFDETPGKFPKNKGIYCRSYCPSHPDVHNVVFALIDELADAFEAKAVHCGMDEVFILGDKDCKRCAGKTTAQLFAQEVKSLHDHLASKGRKMWMWGDRFLDGRTNGLGEWEAAINLTHSAIDMVPKDITICDWHYESAEPTPAYFAYHGFDVLACPWRKPEVAKGQVTFVQALRAGANKEMAKHAKGVMTTCWSGADNFMSAYYASGKSKEADENVATFRAMLAAAKG